MRDQTQKGGSWTVFSGSRLGDTSDSPWIVISVVRQWIPDDYLHAVEVIPIVIPISDLDLWHPVHTRQLQPPPWFVLWIGMGAAVVLPLRVAVPIDGAFSHPAPTGCWLNSSASRLHVYAGCSLTVNETTEYFIKIHSSVQKTLKYLPVWITN